MGFEPPTESFRRTSSQRHASFAFGSSPEVPFPSAHMSGGDHYKRFTSPLYGPRPGFRPSPRATYLPHLLTMFQARAPMGFDHFKAFTSLYQPDSCPLRRSCSLVVSPRRLFPSPQWVRKSPSERGVQGSTTEPLAGRSGVSFP